MAGGSASVAGGAEQVRACLRAVRGRRAACYIVGNPPSPAAWFLKGLIGTWPAAGGADTVTNLRNLCAYAFSFVPIWAYAHKVHASVIRLWRSQLRSRHSVKR